MMKTYLIFDPGSNLIKIGKARDVNERIKHLQIGCGSILELRHVFELDIESILHSEFKNFRVHGEWFNIRSSDVIDWVSSKNEFELLDNFKYSDGDLTQTRFEYLLKNNKWITLMKVGSLRKAPKNINFNTMKLFCDRYSNESGKNIVIFEGAMVITRIS